MKRRMRDSIVSIVLSFIVIVMFMPLLGGAAYATEWGNVSSEEWGFYLKTDKAVYNVDESINFCIEGFDQTGKGPNTIWLGLYEYGASDGYATSKTWAYINEDCETTLQDFLSYPSFDEGKYHLIATTSGAGNDPGGIWATLDFTVGEEPEQATATISLNKTTYSLAEEIIVTCATNDQNGWVAVFPKNASTTGASTLWYYPDSRDNTPTTKKLIPDVGTLYGGEWQIVYLDSGRNQLCDPVYFTIVNPTGLISANKSAYKVGENIEVSLNADYADAFMEVTPNSWVGLYDHPDNTGGVDKGVGNENCYYKCNCSDFVNGKTSILEGTEGGKTLEAGATGKYRLILFTDGYNVVTNNIITITINHYYSDPEWEWNADHTEATATFACTDDQNADPKVITVSEDAITSSIEDPDCVHPARITYTATIENVDFMTEKEGPFIGTETVDDENSQALGHNMTPHEAVDATCTTDGNSAYWSCDRCNKYFEDEEGETEILENSWFIAAGHKLAAHSYVAPTCESPGTKACWECSVCHKAFSDEEGYNEIDPVIEKTGHNYELTKWDWATDFSTATATFTCANDSTHVETATASIADGTIEKYVISEPGCIVGGENEYTAIVTFEDSEYSDYQTEIVSELGHNYDVEYKWEEDGSSCIGTASCKNCNDVITENGSITSAEKTPAACEANGTTTYTATFTKEPFSTQTKDIEDIKALGHDYKDVDGTAEDATCTKAGKKADQECSRCHDKITGETVAALGHDYKDVDGTAEDATCTKAGKKADQECSRCHDKVTGEAIAAFGHDYKDVADTAKDATCTEAGKKADQECSRCHDKVTGEAIAALGHKLTKVDAKEPTKEEEGNIEYWTCSACKKFFKDEAGTEEITEKDTVIAKLPDEQKDDEKAIEEAKEDLSKAIDEAKKVEQGNYTDESYKALQDAIAEAETLTKSGTATKAQLDAAAAKIAKAKDDLKEKEKDPTDEDKAAAESKEALDKAVDEAKKVEQGNYTDESYKALQDAIAEAEALAKDGTATKAQLDAAAAKIADAKAALKEKVPEPVPAEPTVTVGDSDTIGGNTYVVTSVENKEVAFTKAKNKKTITVPETVVFKNDGEYRVTSIGAKAFKAKKIRTVTIGKNVKKIDSNAFKSSKATKLIVKTQLLKKATVKGSLKGSKIKSVSVKIGSKKTNKKFVKKYKKYFTKKNAGKNVKVS